MSGLAHGPGVRDRTVSRLIGPPVARVLEWGERTPFPKQSTMATGLMDSRPPARLHDVLTPCLNCRALVALAQPALIGNSKVGLVGRLSGSH
jgi:hypothetical protein